MKVIQIPRLPGASRGTYIFPAAGSTVDPSILQRLAHRPKPSQQKSNLSKIRSDPNSHRFLREFIELYRSLPCLWKYSDKHYKRHGAARKQAYLLLIKKLREVDPHADQDAVVRKINSLRTCVRRERRNMLESNRTEPKLWYYSLLTFIMDEQHEGNSCESSPKSGSLQSSQNRSTSTRSSLLSDACSDDGSIVQWISQGAAAQSPLPVTHTQIDPLDCPEETNEEFAFEFEDLENAGLTLKMESSSVSSYISSRSPSPDEFSTMPVQLPNPETPRKTHTTIVKALARASASELRNVATIRAANGSVGSNSSSEGPLMQPAKRFAADSSSSLDQFGDYIVSKLQRISPRQSIIAEKIIAEVLMRGTLGTLDENTALTPSTHS